MSEEKRKGNGVVPYYSTRSGELMQRQMMLQAGNLVEALTEELSRRELSEIPTKDLVNTLAKLTLAFVPKVTAVQSGGGGMVVEEAEMAEVVAIAEGKNV